jgi:hypothetical protein
MRVRLHESAVSHARALIRDGKVVRDERDDWSEHQPTAEDENRFVERHGFAEYGKWHLGVDDAKPPGSKAHYKFPYGDFSKVHRCALLAAESRAGQYGYREIELAAAHLHGAVDALADAG